MRRLIDKLVPRMCVLCGYQQSDRGLCDFCRDLLPVNSQFCFVCGQPLATPATDRLPCGACQVRPPIFDRARAACLYEFPIDAALKKLKFQRRLVFAPPLARLLVPLVDESFGDCDVIVPVPLGRWRQLRRGFNQADELARCLSRHTGLPVLRTARRRRATAPQSGLSAAARSKNLYRAFAVNGLGPYRHPLIVDDVMTTGATCNDLARALKSVGAETVSAITVARSSGG